MQLENFTQIHSSIHDLRPLSTGLSVPKTYLEESWALSKLESEKQIVWPLQSTTINYYDIRLKWLLSAEKKLSLLDLIPKKANIIDLAGVRAVTLLPESKVEKALGTSLGDHRKGDVQKFYDNNANRYLFREFNYFNAQDLYWLINYSNGIGGNDLIMGLFGAAYEFTPKHPVLIERIAECIVACLKPGGVFITEFEINELDKNRISKAFDYFETLNVSLPEASKYELLLFKDNDNLVRNIQITASNDPEIHAQFQEHVKRKLNRILQYNQI